MNALVLSGDPELVDDVRRLAAAASVEVEVAAHAAEARAWWHRAAVVLLGADALAGSPPRRDGLVVLSRKASVAVYRRALDLGAEHVAVLPEDEPWLTDRLLRACSPPASGRVVAVTGARGGAGASVLAATLALVAARRNLRVLLLDLDPLSAGLDVVLGLERAPGTRWPDLTRLRGRLAPDALRGSLPSSRGVAVLSHTHDRPARVPAEALASVLSAARHAYTLTVADCPRDALPPADETLLLVPAEVRSVLSARSLAATPAPPLLITRGPAPARLPSAAIAETLSLPLYGHYDFDHRIPPALEQAALPTRGPLARLCTRLLATLLPGPP
ncbi:septum site-determining protein Ssd [Actinocorallia populi]|uniref:septum site-determining protein Ssd n=1 Tax=Actinocorallia populi TaxID=2079200 RepID=UPI000D08D6AD|nr:septum site-determining protein Ssd [Actinocorallia populi]